MATRTLTIRGIPDGTLERLRARAESNHRSLNGELLTVLENAARCEAASMDSAAPSAGGIPVRQTTVMELAATPYTRAAREDDALAHVDRDALARVCVRYHIRWLAVFGSQARGNAHAQSDVDVVVEFAPGMTPGFGIVRVEEALRPLFGGRRVDLVTRRGLSPRLRDRVLSSAQTLYAAQ